MTTPHSIKISKRYQISVPAAARDRLNLQSGDRLIVDIQDGMLILLPLPRRFADHLAGLHREIWEGVDAQAYVDQERDAWES